MEYIYNIITWAIPKHPSTNHVTHAYALNSANLAQAKELSLRREEPLAQATSFRLSETANREHVEVSLKLAQLAQARLLSLRRVAFA